VRNPSAFVVHALSRQEGLTQEVKDLKAQAKSSCPMAGQLRGQMLLLWRLETLGWHLSLLGCGGHDTFPGKRSNSAVSIMGLIRVCSFES